MNNTFIKRFGPKVCSWIPRNIWHNILNIDIVLPHWHIVSDNEIKHVSGLYQFRTIKQFKADLEFFLRYYKPVSLNDIILSLDGRGHLPRRCFLPSFDDGFREIYDIVAPTLLERGIPAVFFIITSTLYNHELCYPQKKSILINTIDKLKKQSVEAQISLSLDNARITGHDIISRVRNIYYLKRHILDEVSKILECDFTEYVRDVQPYLSIVQIKELIKKGFSIGAHSIDHPLYSELNIEEQLIQTLESMQQISTIFGYSCNAFAFPYRDDDISPEFFQRAFSDEQLKISFGIGGIGKRSFSRNLLRFSMERTEFPATLILARQFGRTFLHGQYKKQ